ncbi:acyltransferase [Streptomyces sp. P9-2B-2]|uniref:acyltransferase family protein n=1 Tax=Streptomyces sp. P9-2B-2 TaxID=3057114 RepID=UPI0025B3AE91|nr:acyltransferase [Streptomyces sp. P9-2B-2]WJY37088.1 acyltransferase [Streptomyces sp. P9-2B-2]
MPSLTGLRFIAALLVFAFHATWQGKYISGSAGEVLGKIFANSGSFGVTFFFVLSGFVLTWSARPNDTAPRLWRRRLVKIFPNHVATFALAAVLMLIAAQPFAFLDTFASLFLIQAWIPDMTVPTAMNPISWSLSCELFFYLCFPALLWVLNRVSVRMLWALAGSLAAFTVLAPVIAQYMIGGAPLPPIAGSSLTFEQIWFVYFFPPVRAIEFVLGMVTARLMREGAWPRLAMLPALLIAAGGYAVNSNLPYLYSVGGMAALWLTPLVAAAADADRHGMTSRFRGKTLVRLGELSFAFYMVHGLIMTYAHTWFVASGDPSPSARAGILLVAFVVSLLLAHVLFTLIESPTVRRFATARLQRPSLTPVAPVPQAGLEAKE